MAIKLTDKTNIDGATTPYPYGKTRDNTGTNNGTPYNTATNGDYFQFFERLMALADIVHNGNPENLTDGFQFNEALKKYIIGNGEWLDINFTGTNFVQASSGLGYYRAQYRVNYTRSIIEFRGVLQRNDTLPTLPVAVGNINITNDKKTMIRGIVRDNISGAGSDYSTAIIQIATNGNMEIVGGDSPLNNEFMILDGCFVSFKLVDTLTT